MIKKLNELLKTKEARRVVGYTTIFTLSVFGLVSLMSGFERGLIAGGIMLLFMIVYGIVMAWIEAGEGY
jgi:hypothetical protein